jgi:hypothetical protein
MAAKAIAILSDAKRHERMRAAAAQRALAFATELVVPQYEALYEDVMSG